MMKLWGINCDSDLALVQGYPGAFDLSAFKPDLLRYPGGTWSNYYDWRSGWARPGYIEWADADYSKGKAFKLEDFARMFPPPMRVLWTLNVVTDSLLSQLDMLRHAVSLGYAVEYIELGNEIHPINCPDCSRMWPTGSDYSRDMQSWIAALRREFPEVKIAAAGSWDGDWNKEIVGDFDAVALHVYSESHGNDFDVAYSIGNFIQQLHDYTSSVPAGKSIWLTEYGSSSWHDDAWGKQQGTETQATIERIIKAIVMNTPRIDQAILHTMCGIHADSYGLYNGIGADPPDALAPFGKLML